MVAREVVRRITLYDLVKDTSKTTTFYKERKVSLGQAFIRINTNLARASIRIIGDIALINGGYLVMNDMDPVYLLYGALATAVAYTTDYLLFK